MDQSRHTVTKYLNDKKTHSAINKELFKRPNFITNQLYAVELVKSEVQHREPIIVGFLILHYAKLKSMNAKLKSLPTELFIESRYPFQALHTEKYEVLEKDTDSL